MSIEYVPGIWDYLGQAFGNVSTAIERNRATDKADARYEEERKRQKVLQIAQMVKDGSMDSVTANNDPDVKALGYRFAPSPHEVARNIMKNPMGTPVQVPDISKYVAPTGIGAMPTPITPVTTYKPYTADERSYAGLSPESAVRLEDITNRYLAKGPSSVTQAEAIAAKLKTPADIQADRQKQLQPLLTEAATRHVDQITLDSNINPFDVKQLRSKAAALTERAYQNWLAEAQQNGSLSSMTPEDRAYAKSYFSTAMTEKVKEAQAAKQRMDEIMAGRGGQNDKSVAVYSALTNVADDFDRQAKERTSGTLGTMAMMGDPSKMSPEMLQERRAIEGLRAQASTYRQNALGVLIGKVDPTKFNAAPGTLPAVTTTTPGKPSPTGTPNIEEVRKRIIEGGATLDDAKKYLLDAGLITQEQYNMLKAAVEQALRRKAQGI